MGRYGLTYSELQRLQEAENEAWLEANKGEILF
jgi:hypothetical protein